MRKIKFKECLFKQRRLKGSVMTHGKHLHVSRGLGAHFVLDKLKSWRLLLATHKQLHGALLYTKDNPVAGKGDLSVSGDFRVCVRCLS